MTQKIDITILVPTLNEELTIENFIFACKSGIKKLGVNGQIIIADSSSDKTAIKAKKHGVEVVKVNKKGLGNAYKAAIPYIKSDFVIMGDADLTYDFSDLSLFYKKYKEGYEFIMGSRFKGNIEKNAMPKLHRYFGIPLTSFIFNRIYTSDFSDIHCGMRGATKEALKKIDLKSSGWEYASEMVLKSCRLNLKSCEVPIDFYKDKPGRVSHHKRIGFISPWIAGWVNLKVMLSNSPDSILIVPSIMLFIFSSINLIYSTNINPQFLSQNLISLNLILLITSQALLALGLIAKMINNFKSSIDRLLWSSKTYDYGITVSLLLFILGLVEVNKTDGIAKIANQNWIGIYFIITSIQLVPFFLITELLRQKK
jgi:glycosyltransferase involved in cell wall biosynthesis